MITTQRPKDLTTLSKDNYFNEHLHFKQSKTGKRLAIKVIPSLKQLIEECLNDGIESPYILHRIPAHTAMAKRNTHITQCAVGWLSREFAFIRDKLPEFQTITKEKLPTFYEIRSLAKARYKKLGYNSKDLAGHATEKMHKHYLTGHDIWEDIEINVNITEND